MDPETADSRMHKTRRPTPPKKTKPNKQTVDDSFTSEPCEAEVKPTACKTETVPSIKC